MFCSKCGCELNDDDLFCRKCGTKVNGLPDNNAMSNSIIDRDALKVHLHDVLALECIRNKYQQDIKQLKTDIEYIEKYNFTYLYDVPALSNNLESRSMRFHYDGKQFYILHKYIPSTGNAVLNGNFREHDRWLEIEPNLRYLKSTSPWIEVGYGFGARKAQKCAAAEFSRLYENFKKYAPIRYKENQNKIIEMATAIDGISNELSELDSLLQQTYNINIIPNIFRNNLYAIYYLHDFINTSNESLSTALLHYNLEEIKDKLDTIIDQQQSIIIQQSMALAQNNMLIQQNESMLNRLSHIESNTILSAQYTEIAAKNTEINTWISIANYLDKSYTS